MTYVVSEEGQAEIGEIWIRLAREGGGLDVAMSFSDQIEECFWLLARFPFEGQSREADLGPGLWSYAWENYLIIYSLDEDERIEKDAVLIHHLHHASRDLEAFSRPLKHR